MTAALVALGAALAAALVLLWRVRRRDERLDRELEELRQSLWRFLEGGEEFPVSVTASRLSALNGAVARLCEQVALARENKRRYDRQAAELVADISHQFKTPLAGMRLYAEMDMESRPDGPAEKQLRLIGRMEALIRSLLRLEKLNANACEMRMEPGDMAALARGVAAQFQELYPSKRITPPAGEAICRFDAYWMGEALTNVVKNACEHTGPRGAVAIEARLKDGLMWLEVLDDGGGVPPERVSRLFDRFNRAAPERGARDGCGLGLAITKSILLRHHGDAMAENAGKGLRVTLYLPEMADGLSEIAPP